MPKFMEETGMYKLDTRTGVRTPISMGTIAYWKNKLNLKDYDIYKYHRDVTKRITIDYEDWTQSSRRLNREKKIKKGVLNDPEETKLVCVVDTWKLYPKENEKTEKD